MRRVGTGGRSVTEGRKPGCLIIHGHGQRTNRRRAAHDAPIRQGEMTRQIGRDIEVEILTWGAGSGGGGFDNSPAAQPGAGAGYGKNWWNGGAGGGGEDNTTAETEGGGG